MAQLEPSIWRFVGFVIAYLIYLAASTWLSAFLRRKILPFSDAVANNPTLFVLIQQHLVIPVSFFFIAATLFFLTGVGHFAFFSVAMVTALVLVWAAEITWQAFGDPSAPWLERQIWYGAQFARRHPRIMTTSLLVGFAAIALFPVYLGYQFFTIADVSNVWQAHVLIATLGFMLFINLVLAVPPQVYVMINRNIGDATRSKLFVAQCNVAVQNFILLLIIFWLLEAEAAPSTPVVAQAGLDASMFLPSLTSMAILLAYVGVVLIMPYIAGHFNNRNWQAELDGYHRRVLSELKQVSYSVTRAHAQAALSRAQSNLDDAQTMLDGDERFAEIKDNLHKSRGLNGEGDVLALIAKRSVPADPRYRLEQRLSALSTSIEGLKAGLADEAVPLKELRDVVGQIVEREGPSVEKSHSWILSAIVAALLFVGTPMLNHLRDVAMVEVGLTDPGN